MVRQLIRSLLHHRCRSLGCVGLVPTAEQCLHGGWTGALVGIGVWCLFRAVCIVQAWVVCSRICWIICRFLCAVPRVFSYFIRFNLAQSGPIRLNGQPSLSQKWKRVPIFFALFCRNYSHIRIWTKLLSAPASQLSNGMYYLSCKARRIRQKEIALSCKLKCLTLVFANIKLHG